MIGDDEITELPVSALRDPEALSSIENEILEAWSKRECDQMGFT